MGRAPCCDKDGLKKGPWLPEEDQKLTDYIQKHGPGNWRTLPKKAGLQRCGKSCRLRWTNYLRPDIKRGRFSFEEEETIIQLHSILGNKWSAIAAKLPGRTDNEIKNYWNTHIKKRLLRMGIDPVTHTRRLDLLDLPSIFNHSLQNSQINLLNLLGSVNPDQLLKLNYLLSNLQATQQLQLPNSCTSQLQNQFNPVGQITSNPIQLQPYLSHQYPTNISGFDAQNFGVQAASGLNDQWASISNNIGVNSDLVAAANQNYVTDDSAFELDKSKQSLSLSSSSSQKQTPLSSNSVCDPNSSSSRSQDEIDSYGDSLINFDVLFDIISGCTSS